MLSCFVVWCCDVRVCVCPFLVTGDRDGGRGGYGGDRFGDKKMGPGGDFNPEFQRVSFTRGYVKIFVFSPISCVTGGFGWV